jgi:hypothetical protein
MEVVREAPVWTRRRWKQCGINVGEEVIREVISEALVWTWRQSGGQLVRRQR